MNVKSWLAALSCGAIMAGCASMAPEKITPVDCTTGRCEINVLIDAGGNVSVDKPLLRVTARNVEIFFNLPAGSEFNTHLGDGVFLKAQDSDQFSDFYPSNPPAGGPPHKGKAFHWKDKNDVKGLHDYKILFHDSTGKPKFLDPTIMNDG